MISYGDTRPALAHGWKLIWPPCRIYRLLPLKPVICAAAKSHQHPWPGIAAMITQCLSPTDIVRSWIKGFVGRVVIGCAAEVIADHPRSYDTADVVFDPVHYLRLIEHKIMAFDQAAPLQGWDLPAPFKTLQRLLEARQGKTGKREYVQVLRLLEPDRVKILGGGDGGLCHHDLPRSHVVRRFGAGSPAEEAPGLRGSMWGA